ncbi:MAG: hypothetical protein L0212_08735, partial [Acidobacteria bacterium]|nr:hypothetical protein [Acidobacteriota bacterium]
MKPARGSERARLHDLAHFSGVDTTYRDYRTGRARPVGDETLVAVLRLLGVELRSFSDARRAL